MSTSSGGFGSASSFSAVRIACMVVVQMVQSAAARSRRKCRPDVGGGVPRPEIIVEAAGPFAGARVAFMSGRERASPGIMVSFSERVEAGMEVARRRFWSFSGVRATVGGV